MKPRMAFSLSASPASSMSSRSTRVSWKSTGWPRLSVGENSTASPARQVSAQPWSSICPSLTEALSRRQTRVWLSAIRESWLGVQLQQPDPSALGFRPELKLAHRRLVFGKHFDGKAAVGGGFHRA